MSEKYPTWLTGHVKEWAQKRLPTVTLCSTTGNELLEVWYYGDLLTLNEEPQLYIVPSYFAPELVTARDPESGEEFVIFDGGRHGYDNLFCDEQDLWNSQENRTPMSKTLSGKRVIGEASSFDQWREIQFIGSVAPAAVVVGLDPAEYDLANLIPLHGGAVEPVDQFLLQRCEKTLHARVVKAAMRAAHALPDGTEPGEHRPVLLAGVLAAVVGVQYQPLLITIA